MIPQPNNKEAVIDYAQSADMPCGDGGAEAAVLFEYGQTNRTINLGIAKNGTGLRMINVMFGPKVQSRLIGPFLEWAETSHHAALEVNQRKDYLNFHQALQQVAQQSFSFNPFGGKDETAKK